MTSENFGCHDISRHRWGASVTWEICCFGLSEGVPWSLWWLTASPGCTAREWGATGGGWGALRVGGAFVQYAQPLASRSRPSWNRPTRAKSGQLWEGPEPNPDHRAPAQTAGRGQWGRTCDGAPGRAARTPDSLLRGLVSTALTLAGLPPKNPAEIVGILRFLSGVQRRYGVNVSTMDTSDLPGPARPLPFGASSPTGQSTCPRRSALEPEGASSTPTRRAAATEPAARAATAATSGGSDRRTGRSPRLSPPQGRTSAEIRPSWPHRCAHGTWRAAP